MKVKVILFSILTIFSCVSSVHKENLNYQYLDEIDKAAKELKEQLLLNYKPKDRRALAIASFARNDLVKPLAKYILVTPKLGIYLANALQNEMFKPDHFDLVERQRIDGILDEILYGKIGLADASTIETIKLSGADLLLLGTIQKRNNTIRFDARIVNISDGKIASVGTAIIPTSEYILKLYEEHPESKKDFSGIVTARDGWQVLNVLIESNTSVKVEAQGYWSMTDNQLQLDSRGSSVNPSQWGDFRIFSNLNHGQLVCRLNTNRELIFSTGEFEFQMGGYPECRINDTALNNNSGYITVTIKHGIQ
ncbi:CsgG/HfaB family protein [Leptospira saintgironsiae]|uniref:Curli production assembly/transport component CsgG domain protein n=1 Tax=Leptospira saintgironsiae TaxID=2023183 RepID=A0A2M9YBE4_9LEPT|nr:CsgG/HfaB family protein [Leptospira saintgironsiae]PJZ48783.1 curli production assembly/transport component CsgG domain protein [Leptospira saintgironsiae]